MRKRVGLLRKTNPNPGRETSELQGRTKGVDKDGKGSRGKTEEINDDGKVTSLG
jgi:hypothetical protein